MGFTIKQVLGAGFLGVAAMASLIALAMWGCPQYGVYSQTKSGEAQLAEATYSRRIKVQEAEASESAAVHLAQVDVARAKGVAQANQIIGQSLKQNEDYLIWLWIEALKDGKNDVIYVPTEANLPLLEAGRLHLPRKAAP